MATVFNQSSIDVINGSYNIYDSKAADDFVLTVPSTITGATVALNDGNTNNNGQLDNFSGTLGWAIYSNDNGKPGTLLYSGVDNSVGYADTGLDYLGDVVNVSFDFGGPIDLDPGTYFLAVREGAWGDPADATEMWWQPTTAAFGATVNLSSIDGSDNWILGSFNGTGNLSFSIEGSTNLVVSTDVDLDDGDYSAGHLSLREAIKLANGDADANTITFDANLAGQTITLTGGELVITSDVTIDGDTNGDDKADVTISGNDLSRIFRSSGNGTDVNLLSLTLEKGKTVGSGGAFYGGDGTTLDIVDSTVRDSEAGASGGGILSFGTLTVTNSTISGNFSSNFGGGVYVGFGETATFVNTTITGNSALSDGGGIDTGSGTTVVIINSTIVANSSNGEGGGLDIYNGSTATITNSVIAQNSATNQTDVSKTGVQGTVIATNSVFGSNVAGVISGTNGNLENVTLAQLGLGALGDHGGTVQTINIIDPNSILIDAGDNNLVPLTLSYDANGNPRISRGNVDIGAVEYQNTAPAITDTSFRIVENRSLVGPVPATDAENDTLAFTITGGKDAGLFDIDGATGALSFKAAPDFENPADFDGDNVYEVRVSVDDGFGGTDTELISVRVTNGSERPVITSDGGKLNATVSVAENATAVTKVVANDPDGSSISYAISGGDDKALFAIDATTGKVTFKSAPDFEEPQDKNHDNAYQITVRVTDSDGAIDVQYLTINVTDVDGVTITGTEGADKVSANKTVDGQPLPTGEEDHILGLGGNDRLSGLGGDDILEGGAGKDILKGGAGHDHFTYLDVADSSGTGIDRIRDFTQGEDMIDLSAIDGGFHFLGEAGFDGTAGALRQRTSGSDVFLEGDTDGNGVADLVILLKGAAGLVLTDSDLSLGLNI